MMRADTEADGFSRAPEAKPLRVLLVSSSSGSRGGGELYLVGLVEGLLSMGHRPEVVLADHPRMDGLAEGLSPRCPVYRVPYRSTYDRALRSLGAILDRPQADALARCFRSLQPDLIHINKQNLEDGLDILAAAGRVGVPVVATIHITRTMSELGAVGGWLRDRVTLPALRNAGCPYIAIADSCASALTDRLGPGASGTVIHRVWNGVSQAPSADRAARRREWGVGDDGFVMGCVSRIEPQKNPLFALELLDALPENVKLVWVGDGRLRAELEKAAATRGLSPRLHLEGWRNDARERMAGFDVFILPSLYEGFPFALLEAMAAGLPSVASDVDGVREAVTGGRQGFVCPVGDRAGWLAALHGLIDDPAARARMGVEARRRYLGSFSLEAMARGTVEVYRDVIAKFNGTSRASRKDRA